MTMTKKQLKAIRRRRNIRKRHNISTNNRPKASRTFLALVNSTPRSGYRLYDI